MAAPCDTSAFAWARQIEAFRAMGPQARVRLAASMSDEVRRLALDGIRDRPQSIDTDAADPALREIHRRSSDLPR